MKTIVLCLVSLGSMISCVKIVVETQWHPTLVPVHLRNSLCDVIGEHPGVNFDTVSESSEEEGGAES